MSKRTQNTGQTDARRCLALESAKRMAATAALERSMGAALPEEVLPAAKRHGGMLKNGQATTREVLSRTFRRWKGYRATTPTACADRR